MFTTFKESSIIKALISNEQNIWKHGKRKEMLTTQS